MPSRSSETVSVIIPTYNGARFIERTIASALAQTHPAKEIIVVDDGSTDDTLEVLSRLPVTALRKVNGGPASARNAGLQVATGDWIALLDHDDVWHPEKTRRQLELCPPDAQAIFGEKFPGCADRSFADMFQRNYGGSPSSTLIRRETLLSLGGFDDDPRLVGVEDYNLWLRFLLAGHRYACSPLLFDFTPAAGHYSGKPDKMLSAELYNAEKIGRLAGLDDDTIRRRQEAARLSYLPRLVNARNLDRARAEILKLGLRLETLRCSKAFLPLWFLNLGRTLRARWRRA